MRRHDSKVERDLGRGREVKIEVDEGLECTRFARLKRDLKFNTTSRVIESCYHQLGTLDELTVKDGGGWSRTEEI